MKQPFAQTAPWVSFLFTWQTHLLTCSSSSREILSSLSRSYRRKATRKTEKYISHKRHRESTLWNPLNVRDTGHQPHPDTPSCPSSTLTEQLVSPAVEWLAGSGILVLLIVLNWSEVSQCPHEAPEVYLVLSKNRQKNNMRKNNEFLDMEQTQNKPSLILQCWLRLPLYSK